MPDEFVRHKLLDAVGDLALAGAALRGRFVAHRAGPRAEQPPAAGAVRRRGQLARRPRAEPVAGWQTRLPAAAARRLRPGLSRPLPWAAARPTRLARCTRRRSGQAVAFSARLCFPRSML